MGETHVRRFAAEGAKVLLTDMLGSAGEALAEELGVDVRYRQADVASEYDWAAVIAETEAAFGPVNVLVNNAGVALHSSIEQMDLASYRKVIDVNQTGTFLGMQAVIPSMRRAGGGSIVNLSSICGLVGRPNSMAYTASKFAVRGMTKVAAVELGRDNIRVNSVHPGGIATAMYETLAQSVRDEVVAKVPLGRAGTRDEATGLVIFLASDESGYCTGAEFIIDGGLTAS